MTEFISFIENYQIYPSFSNVISLVFTSSIKQLGEKKNLWQVDRIMQNR